MQIGIEISSLKFNLISPEFLIDQNRFLPGVSYSFSQYLITSLLKAVRHKVNNLKVLLWYTN